MNSRDFSNHFHSWQEPESMSPIRYMLSRASFVRFDHAMILYVAKWRPTNILGINSAFDAEVWYHCTARLSLVSGTAKHWCVPRHRPANLCYHSSTLLVVSRFVVPALFCPFLKIARTLDLYALMRAQRLEIRAPAPWLWMLAIQYAIKSLPDGLESLRSCIRFE